MVKVPKVPMHMLQSTAALLALSAHHGQTDKVGRPYFEHVSRVGESFESPTLSAMGYLHDTIEDTCLTPHLLSESGMPFEVIRNVLVVTRQKNDTTYEDFITRIIQSKMRAAMLVKCADLRDNLRPVPAGTPVDLRDKIERMQQTRYRPALIRLESALTK